MAFSEDQQKILKAKLNGKYVKTREQDGKVLSYVEGWRAIAEANRIFGFDAWDRETVHVAPRFSTAFNLALLNLSPLVNVGIITCLKSFVSNQARNLSTFSLLLNFLATESHPK